MKTQILLGAAFTFGQVRAQKKKGNEDLTVAEWFQTNIIGVVGVSISILILIWCGLSIRQSRIEKRQLEERKQKRADQEEEEINVQTTLYNRQEDQQRKIMIILQERLAGKKASTQDGNVALPNFVLENIQAEQMTRDELDIEYSKITPELLDLLDEDAKADIKMAQEKIAELEEKLELYQLERAYKRWF